MVLHAILVAANLSTAAVFDKAVAVECTKLTKATLHKAPLHHGCA